MKTKLVMLLLVTTIATPADPANDTNKGGYEMQDAVLNTRNIQKVKDLLACGVDINAPIGCGTFSPLDGAVATQNTEMLKFLLLKGAKPHGRELVESAFSSNHQQAFEMAQLLLEAGVSPNTCDENSSPLIRATYRQNQRLIKLLLSQRTISLDEMDVDGFTALMVAVENGSAEIIDLLLQAGASPTVTNGRGQTAVSIARQELEKRRLIITKLNTHAK